MRQRHEAAGRRIASRLECSTKCSDVYHAIGAHWQHLDLRASAVYHLQICDCVAGVLAGKAQNTIAGTELERIERLRPSDLCRLHQRDLVRVAPDQFCDCFARIPAARLHVRRRCGVSSHVPLRLEMRHNRGVCGSRGWAGTSRIHMDPIGGGGSVSPLAQLFRRGRVARVCTLALRSHIQVRWRAGGESASSKRRSATAPSAAASHHGAQEQTWQIDHARAKRN
mmetsp:Transcript_17529/g.48067  ORF Transcript_17529/g.48067 Transcript_17529/m.48067 type:complete len:225 (-) Transcript_17529:34-708(-)